jgi:hypothetical protein
MKIRITGLPDKLMFEEGGKQPPKKPKKSFRTKLIENADPNKTKYDNNGNVIYSEDYNGNYEKRYFNDNNDIIDSLSEIGKKQYPTELPVIEGKDRTSYVDPTMVKSNNVRYRPDNVNLPVLKKYALKYNLDLKREDVNPEEFFNESEENIQFNAPRFKYFFPSLEITKCGKGGCEIKDKDGKTHIIENEEISEIIGGMSNSKWYEGYNSNLNPNETERKTLEKEQFQKNLNLFKFNFDPTNNPLPEEQKIEIKEQLTQQPEKISFLFGSPEVAKSALGEETVNRLSPKGFNAFKVNKELEKNLQVKQEKINKPNLQSSKQEENKVVSNNNQTQMPDSNKKTSKGVSPQDIVNAISPNPYEQIKPYEGDKYGNRKKGTPESNASVHSKEEWQKIAEKVGFKGGTNKEFQKYLLESKDPKIVKAIKDLHQKYKDPKSGKDWDDGMLGYRWDSVFDALNTDTPKAEEKPVVPAPNVEKTSTDPLNYDIPVDNFQKDPYNRRKLPFYQIAPDLANFAAANDMYNYWTPDYTHQEIQPPTLNIQDQLNSMDSSMNAVLATTTGDPNIDQARKQAVMNQILQAKDSAYARKQNYDAEGRFKADEFNIGARNKEMVDDINAASTIHNEYVAEAKDNMTYEKMASIQNMYRKYMMNEATENKYEMMSQMFNNVGYDAKTGKMKISSNPNDINAIREQRMKEAQSKPRVQTQPNSKVKTEPTSTFGGRRNLPFLDPNVYDNIDTGLDFENRLDLNYESNANIA